MNNPSRSAERVEENRRQVIHRREIQKSVGRDDVCRLYIKGVVGSSTTAEDEVEWKEARRGEDCRVG